MSFKKDFIKYEKQFLGVRLPEIDIEQKYYEQLDVDPSISNFEFLKRLCWKCIKAKGIDKFPNSSEYLEHSNRSGTRLCCGFFNSLFNRRNKS
mgnify:CR=1 FL=1